MKNSKRILFAINNGTASAEGKKIYLSEIALADRISDATTKSDSAIGKEIAALETSRKTVAIIPGASEAIDKKIAELKAAAGSAIVTISLDDVLADIRGFLSDVEIIDRLRRGCADHVSGSGVFYDFRVPAGLVKSLQKKRNVSAIPDGIVQEYLSLSEEQEEPETVSVAS